MPDRPVTIPKSAVTIPDRAVTMGRNTHREQQDGGKRVLDGSFTGGSRIGQQQKPEACKAEDECSNSIHRDPSLRSGLVNDDLAASSSVEGADAQGGGESKAARA